jgi:kinesin family protein 6/9
MTGKHNVQVVVRTRPTSNFAKEQLQIDVERQTVGIHLPKQPGQHVNNQLEDWDFKFDKVLHNSPQETVYDTCGFDIVDSVLQGYNGTILCYGQTGAGKTFTMSGGTQSFQYRGIIPRALAHIFNDQRKRSAETDMQVLVSYLEIYNETFYDLLDDSGAHLTDTAVREDERGVVQVKGLKRVVCHDEEEALNVLFTGETNRAIAAHDMNKSSSRSHCVFTVHLEMRSKVESSERIVTAKLNLVDLAGSERVGKTGSRGSLLQEARYINKSLSFLEQVVIALANKRREHIPFRQSKLTNVLRDALGGNCKTRLIGR